MTCRIPGMCSRSPTCSDKHCPGHPTNSDEEEHWSLPLLWILACFALACIAAAMGGIPLQFPFS